MINQEIQAKKIPIETNTAIYEDMENFAPKMILDETLQTYERSKPANAYTLSPSTLKGQGASTATADKKTSHKRFNVPKKASEHVTNVGTHSLKMTLDKRCFQKESDLEDHVYQELSDIQAVYTAKKEQETNPSLRIYENTSALHKSHRPCQTKRSLSVGSLDGAGWDGTSASNCLIKGKWLSGQTRKAKGPPVPPPRTSSIKKDTGKSSKEGRTIYNGEASLCGKNFGARNRSLSVPLLEEFKYFCIDKAANVNDFCVKDCDREDSLAITKGILEDERKIREADVSKSNLGKITNKEIKPSKTPPLKPRRSKSLNENAKKISSNTLPCLQEAKTDHVKNLFEIPNDLRILSVSGVSECLKLLNMDNLIGKFQHHLIDGDILKDLTKDTMTDMGIDMLSTLKLLKFIEGWRPRL